MNTQVALIGNWQLVALAFIGLVVIIAVAAIRGYFSIAKTFDQQIAERTAYREQLQKDLADHRVNAAEKIGYVTGKLETVQDQTKSLNKQVAQVRDQNFTTAAALPVTSTASQVPAGATLPATLPSTGGKVETTTNSNVETIVTPAEAPADTAVGGTSDSAPEVPEASALPTASEPSTDSILTQSGAAVGEPPSDVASGDDENATVSTSEEAAS